MKFVGYDQSIRVLVPKGISTDRGHKSIGKFQARCDCKEGRMAKVSILLDNNVQKKIWYKLEE